jgi:dihydropteroate synthase
MGILNPTPDSFYDRGRYQTLDASINRAVEMAEQGAGMIDVGGEKAAPGAALSTEEEKRRVIPVIKAIRRQLDVAISVDTLKPDVAEAALDAGADIINSIGGFEDARMREVAARTEAAIVIMHIQGCPRIAHPNPVYGDAVEDVAAWLADRAALCLQSGIQRDRIVLDPGPGFGKRTEHDLAVIRGIERFTAMPFPILLAASRKKFIGDILSSSVENRLEGSLAVAAWGVLKGVLMVRAHDVRETVRAVRMTEAVMHPDEIEEKE